MLMGREGVNPQIYMAIIFKRNIYFFIINFFGMLNITPTDGLLAHCYLFALNIYIKKMYFLLNKLQLLLLLLSVTVVEVQFNEQAEIRKQRIDEINGGCY